MEKNLRIVVKMCTYVIIRVKNEREGEENVITISC